MGNSNSVSPDNFKNQLISTTLWSLRQKEIIEHYNKIHKPKYIPPPVTSDISQLYQPRTIKLSQLYQPCTIKHYNIFLMQPHYIPPIESNPEKLYTFMIECYMSHILNDKNETEKLMLEMKTKLLSNPDSISVSLSPDFDNQLTDSSSSYNNLLG